MIQRHIYEIIIVRHRDGEILGSERKVATSSEAAMAKIDIVKLCQGHAVDDVEYVILKLGSLRPIQETMQTEVSRF